MKRVLSIVGPIMLLFLVTNAFGAAYYVKPDGNDVNSGLSDAQAWKTVGKVNSFSFQPGDDVYFKCGGTWTTTEVLYADWSGTAAASAMIVAFSPSGGSTVVTTSASHGFSNGNSITVEGTKDYDGTYAISGATSNTFVISHAYVTGDGPGKSGLLGSAHKNLNRSVIGAYYMSGGSPVIGVSGNRPILNASYTTGLNYNKGAIEIWDYDYIKIENLEIKNQWRRGVSITYANYITVDNCRIGEVLCAGLVYVKSSNGGIFTGNELYHCGRDKPEDPGYSDWSPAFSAGFSGNNYIFRNNSVHNNYGEAMIHDRWASGALIEHNTFYEGYNGNGPYLCDSRNATVRYNLIYGGSNSEFFRGGMPNIGISIAGEEHHSSLDYLGHYDIYGNFIANCSKGIEIWGGSPGVPGYVNAPRTDINIYNNTIVGSRQNAIFLANWLDSVTVKNNIFWDTAGAGLAYLNYNNYGTSTNIVFDYNLWSSQPVAGARGSHDPPYAAPQLWKTTGWASLTPNSLDGREFALRDTSPAIGAGTAIFPTQYNSLVDCDMSNWKTNSFSIQRIGVDASKMSIGADYYGTNQNAALLPPSAPTILFP